MAKQTSTKQKSTQYFNSKLNQSLLLTSKFTYEVEIYKYTSSSFNLEDSKFIAYPQLYAQKLEEIFVKEGVRFKRVHTLVGAPEKWLLTNNFTKIC